MRDEKTELKCLITFILAINFVALFFPILRNDDSLLYANIAKHIALSNDWVDLVFNHQAWLDKPHFPFWLTAVSFKIFGINSFAYILPGFIFHLIGALYTYKLAKYLYNSPNVALIASIIYLSAIHLLLSNSLDLRAEAYLLGEIIPASYCWLRYSNILEDNATKHQMDPSCSFNDSHDGGDSCDTHGRQPVLSLRYLFSGALFTALAMMTKGVFTLITISSGVITLFIYMRRFKELFTLKWLIAVLLSFTFIAPELISLYLQFDLHPLQVVFNQTRVSGLKWFFWGSQFGRFFNDGHIAVNHIEPFHYLFFVHTFLWAFLPWSFIFIYAVYNLISRYLKIVDIKTNNLEASIKVLRGERLASIYLVGSFLLTFILFSITRFQLDHYTNILMPFAAILAAETLYRGVGKAGYLYIVQFVLALILLLAAAFLGALVLPLLYAYFYVFGVGLILCSWYFIRHSPKIIKLMTFSVTSIGAVFILLTLVVGGIDQKYDVGYNVAMELNQINTVANIEPIPVVAHNMDSVTLRFYYKGTYIKSTTTLMQLSKVTKPYYLVISNKTQNEVPLNLQMHYIKTIRGNTIDVILRHILNKNYLEQSLTGYSIFKVD